MSQKALEFQNVASLWNLNLGEQSTISEIFKKNGVFIMSDLYYSMCCTTGNKPISSVIF